MYSTIFAVALVNYFDVLHLLKDPDILKAIEPVQIHARVILSINTFKDLWSIGFMFFGLHITLLGYLVFKADYISKILGIMLLIVGISYLIDYSSKFLYPDFGTDLSLYSGWFELIFMFWLIIMGNKKF